MRSVPASACKRGSVPGEKRPCRLAEGDSITTARLSLFTLASLRIALAVLSEEYRP